MKRSPIRCREQTTIRASAGSKIFFAAACPRQVTAIVLALILAAPALATPGSTDDKGKKNSKSPAGSQLEGRVLGPDGKPVRDAVVSVRSMDGDTSWASQPSDKRG